MTVSPKDFASLPDNANDLYDKVAAVVDQLKKVRASKSGKMLVDDAKLTFPKQYSKLNCVTFIHDNYQKVRLWYRFFALSA